MVSKKTGDGTDGVDELFESLGIDDVRTWRGREVVGARRQPGPNPQAEGDDDQGSGLSLPLLAALGLAAVAVLGAVIWLATSRSAEGTETSAQTDTTEIEATGGPDADTADAADADVAADALRATLASLGFDGVAVEVNGVMVAAAAPLRAILGAYTIAAFDDCGGHMNLVDGYHLHGATGRSGVEVDDHAQLIGYAIHDPYDENGETYPDLDWCGGHVTDDLGYHYHAAPAAKNMIIGCLAGQYALSDR